MDDPDTTADDRKPTVIRYEDQIIIHQPDVHVTLPQPQVHVTEGWVRDIILAVIALALIAGLFV